MKAFINRSITYVSRYEFLLLIIPFVCWFFCFRHFFTGSLRLQADAVSYADHIRFYTDNLCKGVYPLWDPTWYNGVPNDFFLRRIGDVNPFLFLIILLKWLGVPSATAFLVFLGTYYFLAGWAFYLIARFLFVDRFFAFTAYILLLFSSWGSEIFYNYIIIIFVPIIWFFYFLLCFGRRAKRGGFWGMCLCVGLVVTTYIPFFFLTILMIFSFLFIVFYPRELFYFLKQSLTFFNKNKVFTVFCVFFLAVSCVPGTLFYKESKGGEIAMPGRHSGADVASAVAVGLENVASGDIISHGYFDRVFDDHKNIDMGDIYVPYLFILLLITTVCARANKLIFFLLFNIFALSLITLTSAAGVHRFLYEHVLLFKFIRNIYYFFWLAMLPMGILLSVSAFRSLITTINNSSRKNAWLAYIIICHLIFVFFLIGHQGILWGAWAAVFISLSYFLVYFLYENKISYPAGFCLILLAVFIQSAQVYGFLDNKIDQGQRDYDRYILTRPSNEKLPKLDLYYASSWFAVLVNYIDPQVLEDYRERQFIVYDNVLPYKDGPEFFKTLQSVMKKKDNIAFVSGAESAPGDWKTNNDSDAQADFDPAASGKLTILPSDANTWELKAHLSARQFLVINDNYNSDWHAFINGRPAHLFRANFSFKGLWVPPGESNIVLRFSDTRTYVFRFALIILFAGSLLYLLVLMRKGPPDVKAGKKAGKHA